MNVRTVGQLTQAIKLRVDLEAAPAGTDRRRLVQKAVTTELTALVKPDTEPYVCVCVWGGLGCLWVGGWVSWASAPEACLNSLRLARSVSSLPH